VSTKIIIGDVRYMLKEIPDESIHCVVTSPPFFGLRDYGTAKWDGGEPGCAHVERNARNDGSHADMGAKLFRGTCPLCGARRVDSQIGLEPTPDAYVAELVGVFREVRRVLRKDGTCWLNLGSSYASGGRNANQSRPLAHVPAYGSDGITLDDLCEPDSAYSGQRDARPDGSPNRHDRNSGNDRPLEQRASQPLPIGHDTEHPDSVEAFPPVSPLDVPHSNIVSSPDCVPDAVGRRATASELPSMSPTYADVAPRFAHSSACTDGTATRSGPSVDRKSGKASSDSACGNPNCSGCGICWAYLAIPFLRIKPKDEINIPHLVALALQADGWYLRQTICWSKPNPMPESVTDRCTKAHEYIFLLTKAERYYFDQDAIREEHKPESIERASRPWNGDGQRGYPGQAQLRDRGEALNTCHANGRNKRSVWTVATQPYSEAHFATFPPALIEPCILAGCPAKACAKCGAPWVREVERETTFQGGSGKAGRTAEDANASGKWAGKQYGTNIKLGPVVSTTTLGFSPSCSCDAGTVPGTVLDCFGGAGTTGLVADRLQRNAILVELNPQYAAMARRRITDDGGMFAEAAE
jgi:DNA modification methylase